MPGFVSIVGAGPWDPELLTLAGRDRLRRADVVLADYLVNPAMLTHCRADVRLHQRVAGPHDGVRLNQTRINELLVEEASAGNRVVRLKGGDPMIFGRGCEEAEVLRNAGIPYELVPGVSAAIAAPEAAGIPLTHRQHTPSVSIVSGYEAYDKGGLNVAWDHLANSAGTIVLMMSVRNCRDNAERLIAAGRDPETPAALIRWGTRGIMRTIVATLATIADEAEAAGLRAPAVLVVGSVVSLRERIEWFERRPLFGKRVVVTRSAPQAGELLHMLAAQGADAVAFPCLAIAPPEDPEALREAVAKIHECDGVILSSPNGVAAFFDALREVGPGDCIACPAGGAAHQLANPFDEDLVYLAIGGHDDHEVCTYPDTGKVMIRGLKRVGWLEDAEYMEGEPDEPRVFAMVDERERGDG